MSYAATGAYYEFSPHEVYPTSGYGGYGAFGEDRAAALGFSADAVLADINAGAACYPPMMPAGACKDPANAAICGACNAAGARATKLVQAGLNELGYDPGPVAGFFNVRTKSAGQAFAADVGVPYGPGLAPSRDVLVAMEDKLRRGETPGPTTPTQFTKVNSTFIKKPPVTPEPKPTGLAALGGMGIALIAVAAIGVGYVVYKGAKRRPGTTAMVRR